MPPKKKDNRGGKRANSGRLPVSIEEKLANATDLALERWPRIGAKLIEILESRINLAVEKPESMTNRELIDLLEFFKPRLSRVEAKIDERKVEVHVDATFNALMQKVMSPSELPEAVDEIERMERDQVENRRAIVPVQK